MINATLERPIQLIPELVDEAWERAVVATNTPEGLSQFRKNELAVLSDTNGVLHTVIGEQFAHEVRISGPENAEQIRSGQLVGYHILRHCCEAGMPRLSSTEISKFIRCMDDFQVSGSNSRQDARAYVAQWTGQLAAPQPLINVVDRFTKPNTRRGGIFMFLLFGPYTALRQPE